MIFKKIKEFSSLFIRKLSNFFRLLPDFIIVGTQRGGTTSLYNYLIDHPNILPAFKKEIHFFDNNFYRGMSWYRAHFPIKYYCQLKKFIYKQNFITGEASPDYMFNPFTVERVYSKLPNVKIIILLRNPVDRAFSHYHMNVRNGFEVLSFENAIKKAMEVYENNKQSLLKKIERNIMFYPKYNYLARSKYIEQIKPWLEKFPRKNILIIKSEDLYSTTAETLKEVLKFINLPYIEQQKEFKRFHFGNNPIMNQNTREFLIDYFKSYNSSLAVYLGINFEWDK